MNDLLHPALLPQGLRDSLPPDAQVEADVVHRMMTVLARHGFERVKPPMIEFETSLLAGPGIAMAPDTFRLMDPISQRMIGIRADMTLQVARIATSRLVKSPRPLRLSYAGQVLRVSTTQLRPERQMAQVGAELIGSDSPHADAEMVLLAVETLTAAGVTGLSVDLTMPTLVPTLFADRGITGQKADRLRAFLDRKDAAALAEAGGDAGALLGRLMAAAGPAKRALQSLTTLMLPPDAAAIVAELAHIVALITAAAPDLSLTIDPVENRGFEYHTGPSFTLFARGIHGELGRGGRYRAGSHAVGHGQTLLSAPIAEPATGFTVYTDTLLAALPAPAIPDRLYIPLGTPRDQAMAERDAGWITVCGLDAVDDPALEARRLGCSHVLLASGPAAV